MALRKIKSYLDRQTENFRVLLVTSVLNNSIRNLTRGNQQGSAAGGAAYLPLYLRSLGANSQQLGILNSLTQAANVVFALPIGWLSDRISLRKVVIAGFVLSVIAPTAFYFSTSWIHAVPVMFFDGVGTTLVSIFATIFYINSVSQASDRATAMSLRMSLIYILGFVLPLVAAIVVTGSGGLNDQGIRPLFLIALTANLFVTIYSVLRLKEVHFLQKNNAEGTHTKDSQVKGSILADYKEIISNKVCMKWITTKAIRSFFLYGLSPFYSIYYVTVKGADPFIFGAMASVSTIGSLIFLIPFGRLADKSGRRKIIYLTRPFNYLSIILTILAPSPIFLLVPAFVGSLQTVSNLMEITMEPELVPPNQRGRQGGLLFFVMGLTGMIGSLVLGYLWQIVDPSILLLLPIVADIPWLITLRTIPDTLHIVYKQ